VFTQRPQQSLTRINITDFVVFERFEAWINQKPRTVSGDMGSEWRLLGCGAERYWRVFDADQYPQGAHGFQCWRAEKGPLSRSGTALALLCGKIFFPHGSDQGRLCATL
jgi:hypothetical protein